MKGIKAVTQTLVAVQDANDGTAGAIVFWRLSGEIDLDQLKREFLKRGLDEKLLPDLPSAEKVFRRAVMESSDKRLLARQVPGRRHAYALVKEKPNKDLICPSCGARTEVGTAGHEAGSKCSECKADSYQFENPLEYEVLFTALLDKATAGDEAPARLSFSGGDMTATGEGSPSQLMATIRSDYEKGLKRLIANDAADWLCQMVRRVQAVALRDTGGVYFVPRTNVPLWREIAQALRESSGHFIAEIPAMQSKDAVAAILDSLNREAEQFCETVEREVTEGYASGDALGARALKTRGSRCSSYLEKLEVYEQLLDANLGAMRDRIGTLQANVAAAVLVAIGDDA